MPPSRAELAAKHARVVELAAAGVPTSTIATELHMDRRTVRALRNEAGHPATPRVAQPLTLEEKWASLTREVGGGHLEWLGERAKRSGTPVMRYREEPYSPAAIAFRMRTGRDAVGQAFAECGYRHCVAPEHVDDTTTRIRDREALRRVVGMPAAPKVCRHGHDQAVDGRREADGTAYCQACKREYRRPLKRRTPPVLSAWPKEPPMSDPLPAQPATTPATADDEAPVDWTRTTGRLLLTHVPEEKRAQAEGFLAVYRQDVRAAALREAAQVAGDITHLPGGAAYQAGYLDAREEVARDLRRLAATAPTSQEK